MLSHEENAALTGVEPKKPLHEPLSRFWYPVFQSDQLADRCVRKVRLLGMNFVVARNGDQLIALEEHCPHRGASLSLARVEANGLRCIYHGWLLDVKGVVVETPNERDSGGRQQAYTRAPLAREAGGLVWLNICESDTERAPFPKLPWMNLPLDQVAVVHAMCPVNWVQAIEGAIDSSHSSFLHSSEIVAAKTTGAGSTTVRSGKNFQFARPSDDRNPRMKLRNTDCGFIYGALRVPIVDPETTVYVRASAFAFPSYVTFPSTNTFGDLQVFVPVDDVTCHFFYIRYSTSNAVDKDALAEWSGLVPGKDIDERGYLRVSSLPQWGQDRAAMASGASFTGLRGVNVQDIVVQESMGPIVDRTRENLGAADLAIMHLRRLLLDVAKGRGVAAAGSAKDIQYRSLVARDGVLPATREWHELYQPGEVNWTGAK
jgi:phthalate 4,5-dioxygenase oxygenase subunit